MATEKFLIDASRLKEKITEWYDYGSGLERSILKDVLDLIDQEAADGINIRCGDKYMKSIEELVAEFTQPHICSMEVKNG